MVEKGCYIGFWETKIDEYNCDTTAFLKVGEKTQVKLISTMMDTKARTFGKTVVESEVDSPNPVELNENGAWPNKTIQKFADVYKKIPEDICCAAMSKKNKVRSHRY